MSWNLIKFGLLAAGWLATHLYRPPSPLRGAKVIPEKPKVKYQLIEVGNRLVIQSDYFRTNRPNPILYETIKLTDLVSGDDCIVFSSDNESIVFIVRDLAVMTPPSELQMRNMLRKYLNSKKMAILGKGKVGSYDPVSKTLSLTGSSSVRIGFRNISQYNKD